jgi:uncharacterized protein (DUF433 family)
VALTVFAVGEGFPAWTRSSSCARTIGDLRVHDRVANQRGVLDSRRILRRGCSMATEYVEQRDSGYYIKDARVSLDSVVYAFLRGESPEGIAESFPSLGLEQIFGALAFYIANREVVDQYLREGREEFEALREQARRNNPALYRKLAEARQTAHAPRA